MDELHPAYVRLAPLDEQTTMQNLYKAGKVDATYNHTVPAAWNEVIRKYTSEYSLHPEVAVTVNVNVARSEDEAVRQAAQWVARQLVTVPAGPRGQSGG